MGRFVLGSWAALALPLLLAAPCPAQEQPAEIYEAATRAYHEGQKCLSRSREPGANQFLENEKAMGHLEQAQRLLERYLALRPDDAEAEGVMSDVLSLLFWCHKMSPMVDPEEMEPEPTEPEPTEAPPPQQPGEDEAAREAAAAQAKAKAAEEALRRADDDARALLERARAYQRDHGDDGMGTLARFFEVSERFPQTEAGRTAKAEAEALQAKLFAVKPVVVQKPKAPEPLGETDKQAIERQLKTWLNNRMKVQCASCNGQGYSECKTCDGNGKLRGRAGRVSTCRKCERGKIACKRSSCSEGIDTRMLEKVVIDARAPYYQEKLRALLGGHKDALELFLEALAATLAASPRAPAAVTRCATEMGITPVQLRDIIEAHGPSARIVSPFKAFSVRSVDRKTSYVLKGDSDQEETVTFERTPEGEWFLRSFQR